MKSMREVDLDTYSLSLLTAKEDILNPRSSTNWALFTYDGIMNRLKLADSGVGGLKELTAKLQPRRPLYGMCRVGQAQPRIAMILWVGNEVDEYRRAECASHIPAIRAFFKEVHIFLPAHTLDEITEERICTLAYNAAAVTQGPRARPSRRTEDRQAIVGTNYKRTIAAAEIQRIHRDSFWAKAEREEEDRKKEEQWRAAEDRRQREKERLLQERRDAVERERRMNEKEQKIKEQRRMQAQMEAEAQKREKIKWEHEEREREEDEVRARYSRSQSEEKAAEAAALVSQRSMNPREFFRQLSSSSLHTASSPSSTSPVRSPYRRLHRSQTDNIFSFNESLSSTPTSPYRSSVVSPYFPSTPTNRSPILFTNTSSSLQNCAIVSTKSQIQLSSPKMMESQLQTQPSPTTSATESAIKTPVSDILESLVFYPPPPTPEQLQPDESEIEFPPPPPGFENCPKSSVNQPERVDDPLDPLFPTSCPVVPEPPSRPLPVLPNAPRTIHDLEVQRDFIARALVISTVEEEDEGDGEKEMEYEGKDATEEEAKKGGGEEKAETGAKKRNRGQEEHDGMTVEIHESQKGTNGKMMEGYESGKDGKMLEECESEEKQGGNIMQEHKSEEDKAGKIVEAFESGKIMEEQESEKIMLKCVLEKEQDRENTEKHEEDDLEQHERDKKMEEYEQDGNLVEALDSKKEQDKKNMEVFPTEKIQYGRTVDECGEENEQEGKIVEKCEDENDGEKEKCVKCKEELEVDKMQDGSILEKHRKEQDCKIIEEFEKIQNSKMILQYMREEKLDAKIVGSFDNEKEQDDKCMEVSETDKIQYETMMEECVQENEQDGKTVGKHEGEDESEKEQAGEIMKEHEDKKIQDRNITDEHIRQENEQDGKNLEKCEEHKSKRENGSKKQDEISIELTETEKLHYVTKMEECGQENEQYGKIEEEHLKENEKEQDWKITEDSENEKIQDGDRDEHKSDKDEGWNVVEVYETEKIQHVKIMEACEQENKQDGKNVEECEEEDDGEEQDGRRLKKQDWTIVEASESEKEHDCKIEGRHEDGSLEEQEDEKDQDWKMTENCKSAKKQCGKIAEKNDSENKQDEITESQQEEQNQDDDGMSHVDVDKAANVTVLRKEESYTEVIKRDEATEVGVQNEKEPLIQTDAVFSQYAPLFPDSHSTEPFPINDACVSETISATQDKNKPKMSSTDTSSQINLPTIQVKSDFSSLNDQSDSDMKEKIEISKNTTSGERMNSAVEGDQTDAETLREDTTVDSSSDLSEGIDAESKTSTLSENQARTGQSDEGEGLAPVCHFHEDTAGSDQRRKPC
ncbi:uncharacterized protein LOC122326806 isoform X2 [Puntigrus tetrazona]|uniref:uncharacterized protein LOC122326806 isoform X2 n=1 Tax=Puntigrus tetrazona TaxID=1606681 RepID=UPI001C8AEB32|nr:uncharacterized protein LOC122326806 isoform X2 [Puntigrus tetrazona]